MRSSAEAVALVRSSRLIVELVDATRRNGVSTTGWWVVGGAVRDLLVGIDPVELDIVVTGDVDAAIEDLCSRCGAEIVARYEQFGTATLTLDLGASSCVIDIAAARTERYPSPGALPIVERVIEIERDLCRRDLSINAIAIELDPHSDAQGAGLCDPFNGLEDLASATLRFLHDASLLDDPTRILRAARYGARLDASSEPHSRQLIADAVQVGALSTISPERQRAELDLVFAEPSAVSATACRTLEEWGVWRQLMPGEAAPPRSLSDRVWRDPGTGGAARARRIVSWSIVLAPLSSADRHAFTADRGFARSDIRYLDGIAAVLDIAGAAVSGLDAAVRSALDAIDDDVCDMCVEHLQIEVLDEWIQVRDVYRPVLDGHDLIELGIAPGVQLGEVLRQLRQRKLQGELVTRAAEEHYVRTMTGQEVS